MGRHGLSLRSKNSTTNSTTAASTERSASPSTPVRRQPPLRHAAPAAAAVPASTSNPTTAQPNSATSSSDLFLTCRSPLSTPPHRPSSSPLYATASPFAHTPPAYTGADCYSPSFGPASPVLLSMSQRAVQLGIEVTWASSPKRRSSSPLVADRRSSGEGEASSGGNAAGSGGGGGGGRSSDLLRRRSLKHRQIFKASGGHGHGAGRQPTASSVAAAACSKRGIHKFNEELLKLVPAGRRTPSLCDLTPESVATDSDGAGRVQSADSAGSSSSVSAAITTSVAQDQRPVMMNTIPAAKQPSTPMSISFGTPVRCGPCETPPAQPAAAASADVLSTSMQNEFLDNSDFDMVLMQSSQDAENMLQQQQQQQPKPASSKQPLARVIFADGSLLENDSIDEYLGSKELDAYISQSQLPKASSPPQPPAKRPAIERHQSMPFAQQSMLSASDEDLMALMDETDFMYEAAEAAAKADGNVSAATNNRSAVGGSMGRHNSMPVVSLLQNGGGAGGNGGNGSRQRPMRPYVPPPMEQSITIHSGSSQSEDD